MQEIHRMLECMIRDLKDDNERQHSQILCEIKCLSGEVTNLRIYKAKVAGMAAAVSAIISAAAWAAQHWG